MQSRNTWITGGRRMTAIRCIRVSHLGQAMTSTSSPQQGHPLTRPEGRPDTIHLMHSTPTGLLLLALLLSGAGET